MNHQPGTNSPQRPLAPGAASSSGSRRHGTAGREWIGILWLVAFSLFFFSLTLPNNGVGRPRIWAELDLYLFSPSAEDGPPSGWQYLPQRFDLMLVAAAILAGAWGWGHLALRLIKAPLAPRSCERSVFAFALGLSGLSLMTLGCGLAGLLSRPLLGSLVLLGPAAECGWRAARLASGRRKSPEPAASHGPLAESDPLDRPTERHSGRRRTARFLLPALCVLAAVPFLLAIGLGAMLPSTDFDAKAYHLEGPKEFYQAGRVSFLPHNVYTSFPFLTEMLTLLAMVLRDDWYRGALAGKAVLMSFGPLTALALYAGGRRFFSPAAGWLAALVYLTTPWTFRISTIAYAEGGLSFYLFAALLATLLAIARAGEREASISGSPGRLFLLAGLLAGSAMACKYTGLVSVVVPLGAAVGAVAFRPRRGGPAGRRAGARWIGAFALGAAVTVGPWLLKNAVETGNPVYPLMYSAFGGRDWDADLNARWRDGHSPPDHDLGRLPDWIVDVTARNDWLSPLLYGLAPLAFLVIGRRRLVASLWLYLAWLFLTWWLLTHRIDRFWVPMIPVAALLAGAAAASLGGRLWKPVCGTVFVAAALFNLALIVSGGAGYNQFLIDLDVARKRTAETAPGIAYLNQSLPPGSKVLCVGEAQVFDARFPVVYNTVFDRSIFEEWFAAREEEGRSGGQWRLRDPGEIRRKLDEEKITHVFVNWQELLRYRTTYGHTDFIAPPRFQELQELGILGPSLVPWPSPGYENRPEHERSEIDSWAPELKVPLANGRTGLIPWQLFPVKSSEHGQLHRQR